MWSRIAAFFMGPKKPNSCSLSPVADIGCGSDRRAEAIVRKDGSKIFIDCNPKSNWIHEYFRHPDDVRALREEDKVYHTQKMNRDLLDYCDKVNAEISDARAEKMVQSVKDFLNE